MTAKKDLRRLAILALLVATLTASGAQSQELERLLDLIDTSNLVDVSDPMLPQQVLDYDARKALNPQTIGVVLAGEPLQILGNNPQRLLARSENFEYELRKRRAAFLLMRLEGSDLSDPIPGGKEALEQDAFDRLMGLGVSPLEIASTASLQLFAQRQDEGGQTQEPTLAGYKQLLTREIDGIPVMGSRMMMSYTPDFTFRKALGHWPSLAKDGHQLASQLGPEEVAELVAHYLIDTGQNDVTGSIPLRYVYTVVPVGPVTIQLRLMVEASLFEPAPPKEDGDGEKVRTRLIALTG